MVEELLFLVKNISPVSYFRNYNYVVLLSIIFSSFSEGSALKLSLFQGCSATDRYPKGKNINFRKKNRMTVVSSSMHIITKTTNYPNINAIWPTKYYRLNV